ncbi:MAG TPA: hypothetical protein VF950_14800, partial [Planctomycetota bacterium]
MGRALYVVFALGWIPALAAVQPVDVANFTEQTYASGFSGDILTGLAWATDGSNTLFTTQKGGLIRVVRNGALQGTNFASLS